MKKLKHKSKYNYKQILHLSSYIFIYSFLLNFLWESLHGAWLYECCQNLTARLFVQHILPATFVDALIIAGVYLSGIILFKELGWFKKFDGKRLFYVVASTFIIAFLIEYNALFIAQKWSYTSLMPTIFGIGLSPLVQLAITGLSTFYFAKRIICK